MKTLLSLAVVVLAATTLFASDARADASAGTCNAIVATEMKTAQYCSRNGCAPGTSECMAITNALVEFFATAECAAAFAEGELNGLPGNASIQPNGPKAGDPKHVQVVICDAIDDCGLCPAALAFGVCGQLCLP